MQCAVGVHMRLLLTPGWMLDWNLDCIKSKSPSSSFSIWSDFMFLYKQCICQKMNAPKRAAIIMNVLKMQTKLQQTVSMGKMVVSSEPLQNMLQFHACTNIQFSRFHIVWQYVSYFVNYFESAKTQDGKM